MKSSWHFNLNWKKTMMILPLLRVRNKWKRKLLPAHLRTSKELLPSSAVHCQSHVVARWMEHVPLHLWQPATQTPQVIVKNVCQATLFKTNVFASAILKRKCGPPVFHQQVTAGPNPRKAIWHEKESTNYEAERIPQKWSTFDIVRLSATTLSGRPGFQT